MQVHALPPVPQVVQTQRYRLTLVRYAEFVDTRARDSWYDWEHEQDHVDAPAHLDPVGLTHWLCGYVAAKYPGWDIAQAVPCHEPIAPVEHF